MKRLMACASVLIGLVGPTAKAASSSAETWVSNSGSDIWECPVGAPCATFRYALTQTSAGGAIYVATSGSYRVVTFNKAVSILAPDGVEAAISVPAKGTGVTINAGTGVMVLRGCTLPGVL